MAENYEVKLTADTHELDDVLKKARELEGHLKSAKSILDDLAQMGDINLELKLNSQHIEFEPKLDGKKFSQTLKEGDTCDSRI